MSIVRKNLLKDINYRPYCGNENCSKTPRTFWNGKQFECSCCGWISEFEKEFIDNYKSRYSL